MSRVLYQIVTEADVTNDPAGPLAAAAFLGFVAGLSVFLKKAMERIIEVTKITGNAITLVAIVVGIGLAAYFQLDPTAAISETIGKSPWPLPSWVGFIASGIWIALNAGYLADKEAQKKLEAKATLAVAANTPGAQAVVLDDGRDF